MRIFVHDNPGHAFAVQLSRWLAAQGHEVLHCYSRAITSPRGELEAKEEDPAGFAVEAIGGDRPVPKYCLLYTSPSPRDGLLSRMPSSA